MYSFSVIETFTNAAVNLVSGITDLEVVTAGGVTRLYSATRAGGGVMAIDVGASMVKIDEVLTATNTVLPAPAELELVTLGGRASMMVSGANMSRQGGYRIDADGTIGQGLSYSGSLPGVVSAMESLVLGADTYFFLARSNESSIHTYRYVAATQQMQAVAKLDLGPNLSGIDLTTLLAVEAHGQRYLVATSLVGDVLRSFAVAADGTLTPAGVLGAAQGLGLTDPADVKSVVMDGVTYLVMAGSQSSSISVVCAA